MNFAGNSYWKIPNNARGPSYYVTNHNSENPAFYIALHAEIEITAVFILPQITLCSDTSAGCSQADPSWEDSATMRFNILTKSGNEDPVWRGATS